MSNQYPVNIVSMDTLLGEVYNRIAEVSNDDTADVEDIEAIYQAMDEVRRLIVKGGEFR